jgi:hypothetical protein
VPAPSWSGDRPRRAGAVPVRRIGGAGVGGTGVCPVSGRSAAPVWDDPAAQGLTVVDWWSPNMARVQNALLGFKDNYPADRELALKVLAADPAAAEASVEARLFVHRAVQYAAQGHDVGQFLDIGAGMPVGSDVHDYAQEIDPHARIVYVDHDPLVAVHARALMQSSPEGAVAIVEADAWDTEDVLQKAAATLDINRPVTVILTSILHLFDDETAAKIVRAFMDAVTAGSLLVLSHATADYSPLAWEVAAVYEKAFLPMQLRTRDEVTALVPDGVELLAPGVTSVRRWQPDRSRHMRLNDRQVGMYGLVGRKS